MPTKMNCPHSPDGWCLKCVGKLESERAELEVMNTNNLELISSQRRKIEELRLDIQRLQSGVNHNY